MKKFFAIILLISLIFPNLVFAEESQETEIKLIELLFYREIRQNYKNIELSVDKVKLSSPFKNKYAAQKYTLVNNNPFPVKINTIENKLNIGPDIQAAAYSYKRNRRNERFPNAYKGVEVLGMMIILTPMFIVYPPSLIIIGFLQDDDLYDFLTLKRMFITPITSTVFAPYLLVKDKYDDKKMEKDIDSFSNPESFYIIQPHDKLELIYLTPKYSIFVH